MKSLSLLAISLAAAAASALPASAQVSFDAVPDDFVVAFTKNGKPNDLFVDVGSITQFYQSSGVPLAGGTVLNLGTISLTDLSSAMGSDWLTNTTNPVAWAGFGSPAAGPVGVEALNEILATSANNSAVLKGFTATVQGLIASQVQFTSTGATGTTTGHGTFPTILVDTTSSQSLASSLGGGSNGYTTPFNAQWFSLTNGTIISPGSYVFSEIYDVKTGNHLAGIDLGQLRLYDTGALQFVTSAVAAVPEPATYGLILGAVAMGFSAFGRRRKQIAQL